MRTLFESLLLVGAFAGAETDIPEPVDLSIPDSRVCCIQYTADDDDLLVQRVEALRSAGKQVRVKLVTITSMRENFATNVPREPMPFGIPRDQAYIRRGNVLVPTESLADAIGNFYADEDDVTIVL